MYRAQVFCGTGCVLALSFLPGGMNTLSLEDKVRFSSFWVKGEHLYIRTARGKIVTRPKNITEKLSGASLRQFAKFEIIGKGYGVHWPLLDEDLSVAFLIFPEKFKRRTTKSR